MYIREPLIPTLKSFKTTFKITYKNSTGTAFVTNWNNKQYLITAKHIFFDCNSGMNVSFNIFNDQNLDIQSLVFFHDNSLIDIAVIPIEKICDEVHEIKTSNAFPIGQECIFMGFPLYEFLKTESDIGTFAIVKKAIVSGRIKNDENDYIIVLDGHNNPGFSGAPIITHNGEIKNAFIIGVISGYYFQPDKNKIWIEEENNKKKEVEFIVNSNSGIIISYPNEYIIQIIEKLQKN